MWSELHFTKAAATHDTLSVPGDLWGRVVLMVSVGLVSSPTSSWLLSQRQMGDKLPLAARAQQEGTADHPASLGGAAAGKPPGTTPSSP